MKNRIWVRVCVMAVGGILPSSIVSADMVIEPFVDEAVARGVTYAVQPWNGPTGQFQGFGCAIADLNGNGQQDIVIMGDGQGLVGIYENDGTGHFNDHSATSNIPLLTKPSGIALADYNGNGMLDIYITQQTYHANVLLRNLDGFTFQDVSDQAGVANTGYGESAAWADYDNDGWLDLYVVNYTFPSQINDPTRRNQLYRNNADGTFTPVAQQLGVDDHGVGYAAVWSDVNRNGWLDLHVVNDRGHLPSQFRSNQLWRNDGGTFTNISESSGTDIGMWAMGVAAGDFYGNGYPDFYITNLPNIGGYGGVNPLLINQGDETFVDMNYKAGVEQFIFSWAAFFFDFTNNGHLDLYVCNQGQANNLFANSGSFPTQLVTEQAGVQGTTGNSFNAAYGDVTGNGSLDILLNNYGTFGPTNVQLFINYEGNTRNWMRFNVVGHDGNTRAIGANIDLRVGDTWHWREIYAGGNNFKSQNEMVFHFGLNDTETADEIVVNWPGGNITRTLSNYPANHTWTIYPPERLGDATGDGSVGLPDLLALLGAWGSVTPGAEVVDMNGDGVIDVTDILQLLSKWTGSASTGQAR